jgi:hypothetical protein
MFRFLTKESGADAVEDEARFCVLPGCQCCIACLSLVSADSFPIRDRILCVVRELTDDSRRGAGGTAHKINWMKEHYQVMRSR